MNNATRAFFRSGHGVLLAVYDTRRGQVEGREAEKILAFYPPTATAAMQSSVVGLAQALTMFAGTFNKECPFHTMEAQGHVWTMYHAEPDLWLLLVAGRALLGPDCLPSSLSGLLKGLHSVMVLLHGLLSAQLEQDAAGARVRRRLQPLLQEAAGSLLQPDPAGLWSLSCPLGLTGGVPLLPVSAAAFTRMQSLTNSLLAARLFSCRPVLGVLVAWQTCLLWSSLGSADTAALHSLVVRGLEPAVRQSSRRHKGVRWPLTGSGPAGAAGSGPAAAAAAAPQSQQQSPLPSPSGSTGGNSSSSSVLHADCVCLASPASWQCWPSGLVLPVGSAALHQASSSIAGTAGTGSSSSSTGAEGLPVSSSAGSGGGAGGSHAAAGAAGAGNELPVVWLQSGCERARLLAWHAGPLLLLLLLENGGPAVSSCPAVTASLLEQMRGPGSALSGQLAAELPAKHLWHVQGLRYLYQDHLSAAVRASPLRKVATLAQPSLHLTADARRWAALEASAAADPTAAVLGAPPAAAAAGSRNGSAALEEQWELFAAGGADADVEVVVRGGSDCWVVARHTAAARQLTAVVEGDKDRGLLGVMQRVQEFCDTEVPGVFDALV